MYSKEKVISSTTWHNRKFLCTIDNTSLIRPTTQEPLMSEAIEGIQQLIANELYDLNK